jgi:predicted Zn finger-like uncharacterized protein
MILTCPQCATRFQADAAKFLPAGRTVKCAKCGEVWHQAPPRETEPETLSVESATQHAEPASNEQSTSAQPHSSPARPRHNDDEPSRAARQAQRAAQVVGWAALALILFLIGWTGVHFRQDIATLWPQSAPLYKAAGLPVNPRGIEIVDVTNGLTVEDGERVLVVSGKLVNISGRELPVPQIRIALINGAQREVYHWPVLASVGTLRPGQSARFHTRLAHPPRAEQVQVTLARSDE